MSETRQHLRALRRIIDSYVDAEQHIKNDLQPEFQRLADDLPLSWVWGDEPFDQCQAASRLATWWHGAWSEQNITEARVALAALEGMLDG